MAIGQNVSARQRLTENLTEKQALNYKPSELGKVWVRVDSKTEILIPENCDKDEYICEWKQRHEK